MNYENVLNTIKNRDSKKIANNTYLVKHPDYIGMKLHNTEVIKFFPNYAEYDTRGWFTNTTKDRMNNGPARIYTEKGQWYIGNWKNPDSMYYDGIQIDYEGKILSEIKWPDNKAINTMKKKIKNFIQLVDSYDKDLPIPSNGDCWYCCMKTTDDNTPLGDKTGDNSHLLSHIDEGYLHGSLILNALIEKGYRKEQMPYVFHTKWIVKNALRSYLTKRLIKH